MRYLMLLSAGACLAGSALAAPLLIDDFSSLTPQSLTQMGLGGTSTWTGGGTMLGGSRGLAIDVSTSLYGLASRWNIVPGVGAVSDNTGNAGTFWLAYFGTGATGTGGIFYSTATNFDFAYDGIEVDMISSDKPFTLQAIFVSDFDVEVWEKPFGAIGSPTTISITSADLVGGAADLSNLDIMVVSFITEVDGDLGLSEVRAVPEPATLATLGLGAFALLRRRRA